MQFSTVATFAAVAAVASAQNITTATATENATTLVTITSCSEDKCHESVSPALVSTATVTVNDVITEYTTWCPLTATTEAGVAKNTTVSPAPKPTATQSHSEYTGAAAKAFPAAGALVAGAAALLL